MGALCGLVLGVTLTTDPNPNPNPDPDPNLSPNPNPNQVLGAFVLVVGVCCRVVTFHVGYRSSNTHHIGSSPMHAPDRPVAAFRYLVTTPTGRRGGLHLAAAREPLGQL